MCLLGLCRGMNVLIVSFWTQRICGIWFRWGLCTGSWLRTAVVCFPMRCSPICSACGAARRYRVR